LFPTIDKWQDNTLDSPGMMLSLLLRGCDGDRFMPGKTFKATITPAGNVPVYTVSTACLLDNPSVKDE